MGLALGAILNYICKKKIVFINYFKFEQQQQYFRKFYLHLSLARTLKTGFTFLFVKKMFYQKNSEYEPAMFKGFYIYGTHIGNRIKTLFQSYGQIDKSKKYQIFVNILETLRKMKKS